MLYIKRIYSVSLLILAFFLLSACDRTEAAQNNKLIAHDKKKGLELIAAIDKSQYELDEKIILHIQIVNHDNEEKVITAPGNGEGIAVVITNHQSEGWHGIFHAEPKDRSENEKGVADNMAVYTIGPHDTLEQDFVWEQKVQDQVIPFGENNNLLAPSGDYKLFAFIMIGEMVLKEGESMQEMIVRYQKNPLDTLDVSLNYKILLKTLGMVECSMRGE